MTDPIPGLPDELAGAASTLDADRAQALTVACPGCGARPGEPCHSATGRDLTSLPAHPRRYLAAGITTSTIPTPEQPS